MSASVSVESDEQQSLPPAEDSAVPPTPVLPDRADAPVSEVAERFLRAVVAEVPLELIEELHLFSPLRQGTVETGIAVLAARAAVVETEKEGQLVLGESGDSGTAEALTAEAPTAEAGTAEVDTTEVATTEVVTTGVVTTEVVTTEVASTDGGDDEDVSYADELPAAVSAEESDEAIALTDDAAPARPVRHTVFTARYRYVIKGPERGKWESSIKAEAEAPLVTVETVVRGVQRRAGEESEIVRYTAAQIARALRVPLPA